MSDQDFFFDEEPKDTKPSGKGSKPAAPAKSASAPAAMTGTSSSIADQSTTWAIASLMAVAGLLLGAILGFLLGTTMARNTVATPTASTPAATAPNSTQPSALTSEQIQSGLPAGHPAISNPASGSANTTP